MITSLQITGSCNLNCTFCLDEYKDQTHMTSDTFNRTLRKLIDLGIKKVNLTGGEPLLHPDINIFLNRLYQFGIEVDLYTNGMHLDRLTKVSLRHLKRLSISIDGHDATNSERMTRGAHAFHQTFHQIQSLPGKHNIRVQTIVSKQNIESLHLLGDLLRKHQIRTWHVRPFLTLGLGRDSRDFFEVEEEDYVNFVNDVILRYKDLEIEAFYSTHKFTYLHITPNGEFVQVVEDKKDKEVTA